MNLFLLQSCPSKLSPETFLAFLISAVDRLTEDTYLVRFALPGNSQLGLRPGQHLILRYTQVVGGPHPTVHSGGGSTSSYGTLRWWEHLILQYTQVVGAPHPTVHSGGGSTSSYGTLRWWEHLILWYTQVVGALHPTVNSGGGSTSS